MKKGLALLLVFVLLSSLAMLLTASVKAIPKTITVPDDYETIQAAVGNASVGDTVFVRSGRYNITYGVSGVFIDKSLSLLGEDSETTIIEGRYRYGGRDLIRISADNVTVSGFTIIAEGLVGINVEDSYEHVPVGCRIVGNNIRGCRIGVIAYGSANTLTGDITYLPSYLTISGNNFTGNDRGLYLSSSNSTVSGNTITDSNGEAITVDECVFLTIDGNTISNNGAGLLLRWWGPFYVSGNKITGNREYGIGFEEFCNNSTVWSNEIANNGIGIVEYLVKYGGKGNVVYHNNIVDNNQQVAVNKTVYETIIYSNVDVVALDNGATGNYWSDYLTRYPNAREVDSTGVGNTSYVIDENNIDRYPLMRPIDIHEPRPMTTPLVPTATQTPLEPSAASVYDFLQPLLIVIELVIIIVLAALLLYFRRSSDKTS